MRRLAILGASGHGKVVAEAALLAGWLEVCFYDDNWPTCARNGHWQVDGTGASLLVSSPSFDGVIVAIGDGRVRLDKQNMLREADATLITVVHPRACLSQFASVGAGSVLLAGAIVSVDATLGAACIVNSGATVDHDCALGDAVHIAPGAHLSGGVSIGNRSWVGVGASVRQDIRIGADVIVGAGAVVVNDVPDGATVIGSPARPRHNTKQHGK